MALWAGDNAAAVARYGPIGDWDTRDLKGSALPQKVSVDMDSIRSALQKGVKVYQLFDKQVSRDYDLGRIATESSLKIDPKQSKWIYQRLAKTSCEWLVRIFSTLLLSRCALLVSDLVEE